MILWFSDAASREQVGGKGAELISLTAAGFSVPNGFVVTTEAFNRMDSSLENEILKAFDALGSSRVAVRSSAIAEDSNDASWAGQFETYLNTNRDSLIARVKDCWASAHSERAEAYAHEHRTPASQLKIAVVIQEMIDSDTAGVAFSANPVTNDRSQIVIEAMRGLGDALVSGRVTPDTYVLSKLKNELVESHTSDDALNEKQLKEIGRTIQRIETHYGFAVDVEWTYKSEQLWIMQARPITTLQEATHG